MNRKNGIMGEMLPGVIILWLLWTIGCLFAFFSNGCSSMHGKKTIEYFDPPKVGTTEPILTERTIIEMKQEQYWTDSSRAMIKVKVEDFGEFSMGMSNLDAESAAEIGEGWKPMILTLLGM